MNQTDEKDSTKQFIDELLAAYFTHRENLPADGLIAEPKTTRQICDELLEMYPLNYEQVALWMRKADFHATTLADGTVAWAIWRQV